MGNHTGKVYQFVVKKRRFLLLSQSRMLLVVFNCQGQACVKFFKILYELAEKIERPKYDKPSKAEKKREQNRKRSKQRRKRDKLLRLEERQRQEMRAVQETDH